MQWLTGRAGGTPPPVKVPPGKPLLLIGFNEAARKWEVNPDAAALLARVPGPLCTLSVCGRARQGKSFLLNTLLGRLTGQELPEGFKVSPTQHSCTRGLWMWSVPIPMKDADGKPCNLLLVDCEGIDAVDQGAQHSAQIFSLAVLLSSVFVYNSLGAIDAVALERLAMVCELAKRIKDRSAAAGRGGAPGGQSDFSPAFVWLLRDFQLTLAAGGGGQRPLTPAAYLEEVLGDVRAAGGADEANRNQMRATIKAVFPDRDAFTLLRPMLKEEDLHRLDTIPYTKLRPEFQKGMEDLMALLRGKAHPLVYAGNMVSGRVYAQLAGAYVDSINSGAVPQLVTAWQGIARAECQKSFDAALAVFEAAFKPEGCGDEEELYDAFTAALSAAVRGFKDSAMGDAALLGEYEERLRKVGEERFTAVRTRLRATSERAADEMLAAEAGKLRAMMGAPGANLDAIEAELRRFLADYDSRVQGAHKYRKASEFLVNTCVVGIKDLFTRVLAEREAAQKRTAAAEAQVQQLRAEAGRTAEAESRAAGSQRELAALRQQLANAEGQLAARTAELGEVRAELGRASARAAEAQSRERQLQAEGASARAEASRLQAALGGAQRAEAEVTQLRSQLTAARAAEAEARNASEAARRAVQAAEARAAQLQSQLSAAQAAGQEVASLRAQLAETQAAADDARLAVSRTAGERNEERAVANRNLREVTELQAQLLREREKHDEAKEELRGAQSRVQELERQLAAAPTPSGAAAAAPATTPATAGRAGRGGRARGGSAAPASAQRTAGASDGRPNKRRRQDDESGGGAEPMDIEGTAAAATPATTRTHRTPQRTPPRTGPAATPASPSTGGPGGTPVVAPGDLSAALAGLPADVGSMSIAALKAWVVDHRLEDEEFVQLAARRTSKKSDFVAYVKRRAGLP
ncbi:hypothetical protein Rsub_11452 [Raphidocelis subcapitata]|uniref:GB1/RHD3-type G domain-containing protein n=1 Tax=Raphidocelis subcapitata TaxID=307507 RepID=A0A2V0PG69_9CHLO|nr:hypothetical protein Rsub_11452 [Raphidocelis subcapitata]|eukprot:GBF98848.1 hypothetical protein Rsub_11452 [Raphidocelis subcapitata]